MLFNFFSAHHKKKKMGENIYETAIICGGAGYIGAFVTRKLLNLCKQIVVVDNYYTGHKESVEGLPIILCEGDVTNRKFLNGVFQQYKPDVAIHLCAHVQVGESMREPLKYYRNNYGGFITLLECMRDNGCKNLIFSSSCAVFGEPKIIPIEETNEFNPLSPYAETKVICEWLLHWTADLYGIKYVILRFFNVAGDAPDGSFGEDHTPETHLVPVVLQVALDQRDHIDILGNDYPTRDGTCIRDYVHPEDIASAHVLALKYLKNGGKSDHFNLANGHGFTVLEVVEACRRVTGHPIPVQIKPRRPGDSAQMFASSKKAKEVLGWHPEYTNLDDIVKTAWDWHSKHPHGFSK